MSPMFKDVNGTVEKWVREFVTTTQIQDLDANHSTTEKTELQMGIGEDSDLKVLHLEKNLNLTTLCMYLYQNQF